MNLLPNGGFEIWQRGTSSLSLVSAAIVYCSDTWYAGFSNWSGAAFNVAQSTDVPDTEAAGYAAPNSLELTCSSTGSFVNASNLLVGTYLEGPDCLSLVGQDISASFWVKSSLAGLYSAVFSDASQVYEYIVPFRIESANTWEKKLVTIPGGIPTSIVSNFTFGVGQTGLTLYVILAAGTSYIYPALTWNNTTGGNASYAVSGMANLGSSSTGTCNLALVQLERGNPTNYEAPPYADQLGRCQRYYQKLAVEVPSGTVWATWPVHLDKAPTVTITPSITSFTATLDGILMTSAAAQAVTVVAAADPY